MPWTITVLPVNPPSMKRSPLRTSVSAVRRKGAVLAAGLAALVGVADAAADVAATTVDAAVALAVGGADEPPQATTNTSASLRGVATGGIR